MPSHTVTCQPGTSVLQNIQFKDDLVQQAENGGHEAARLFKSEVEEYLKNTLDLAHPPKILIRVYANMRGMAKAYKDAGVVLDLATVELFVRGFNMENPLCDFNDAGNGKECSDEKIRGKLPQLLPSSNFTDLFLREF